MSPMKNPSRNDSECCSSDDEVTGGRYRADSGTFDHSDLEEDCKKGVNDRGKKQSDNYCTSYCSLSTFYNASCDSSAKNQESKCKYRMFNIMLWSHGVKDQI